MVSRSWLPNRTVAGEMEYRKQYISHADNFCTCEFDGPFLCVGSALDEAATTATLGYGPGMLNYGENYVEQSITLISPDATM